MFESALSKDANVKKYKKYIDPVIKEDEAPDIYILLDRYYSEAYVNVLSNQIKKIKPGIQFTIIYPFKFKLRKEDVTKAETYINKTINLIDYISKKSKIVTIGKTLYTIIKSDILDISGFYDVIFNKSYFYSNDLDSYIFPVDSLYELTGKKYNKVYFKDTFKAHYFFSYQIEKACSISAPQFKKQRIKKTIVEEPNHFLQANKDRKSKMSLDIETNTLDPWKEDAEILEVSLSFDGIIGYYLEWDKIDKKLLSEFLKTKKLIGQNIKFDLKFMLVHNAIDRDSIHIYHDTWNGSNVINEMQRSSLKADTWLYTIHGGYDNDLEEYKKKYSECKNDYSKIPKNIRQPYSIMDAIVTYQIHEEQQKILQWIDKNYPMENGRSIERYFYEIQIPSIEVFLDIELEGMCVDWDLLRKYSKEIDEKIIELKKEIIQEIGIKEVNQINFDSNNSLACLFECLNWEVYGRSKLKPTKENISFFKKYFNNDLSKAKKEGIYLVGDDQLKEWRKKGYKLADKVIEYRKYVTIMKTFIGREKDNSGYFQYRKKDNKIHSTFGPMLTLSHRNWSKNPNLQNIHKHGDHNLAKWYRKIFIPPSPDYYIDEKDAKGFQLRIGAILSGDEVMEKVFKELGGDMHSMTAQFVLKRDVSLDEFLKRKKEDEFDLVRFKAKGINFQLLFGATSFNFAKTVIEKEWNKKDVNNFIRENNLYETVNHRYGLLISGENEIFNEIGDKEHFARCWTVAGFIRNVFFEKYYGLLNWIEEIIKQADKDGYVRSSFGAIRRLPQLLYQGKEDLKFVIKNLHNIALNSPVQNYENVIMMMTAIESNKYIKENNLKSRMCGNVHDANVFYTHKDELEELTQFCKSIFEKNLPEHKGIPLELESDVSDYYNKNEVWGFGSEYEI